ncbi:hypothetical protein [Nonomuraea sp. NPDC049480]|uniref:hypothetical protein n=1 Tax=Nonomuraea sp. NPDC049480 TaxID=3364353 RepID=UPI0037B721EF
MRLTRRDGPRHNVQDLDLANRRAPIRDARFDGAAGLERAELDGVGVAPAEGVTRSWPPRWRVEETADGWQTLRLASGAEGTAAAGCRPVPEPTPGPEG